MRKPRSLVCYKRGGALQGTGEQIANGRITLLLLFLSPNLASLVFYSELDFNRGSDRGGRVCQVQPSSESLSFSQDSRNETPWPLSHTFLRAPSSPHFLLLVSLQSRVWEEEASAGGLRERSDGILKVSECVLCLSALACKLMITPCKLYILYINRYMNIYYIRQNVNEKEHERDLDRGEQSSSLCWSLVLIL